MTVDSIIIKGARQNNLKNIDVIIPRNKLVVITGISGSGILHYARKIAQVLTTHLDMTHPTPRLS